MKILFLLRKLALTLLCLFWIPGICYSFSNITDYRSTFIPMYTKDGNIKIAIRSFFSDQNNYFLIVDPQTFTTDVVKAETIYVGNPTLADSKTADYYNWKDISKKPYIASLLEFTNWYRTKTLANAGLTHSIYTRSGYFLTIDMCPSVNPYEKDLYKTLVSLAKKQNKAFPVAIAISGLWMIKHPQEFNYLLEQQQKHLLDITWVNHSFSHRYFLDLPLKQNFLLFKFTNIEHEILSVEKLLLMHNQIPSVFIRFPGLITDRKLLTEVQKLGLIPLGADAWLAKDELPKAGSIILVHGNGNEHKGIVKLMPILQNPINTWLSLIQAIE